MCVAVPGRIMAIGAVTPVSIAARVQIEGVMRDIDLVLVPDARPGDYVTTHSGYAIRRLDRAEAETTLRLLGHDSSLG